MHESPSQCQYRREDHSLGTHYSYWHWRWDPIKNLDFQRHKNHAASHTLGLTAHHFQSLGLAWFTFLLQSWRQFLANGLPLHRKGKDSYGSSPWNSRILDCHENNQETGTRSFSSLRPCLKPEGILQLVKNRSYKRLMVYERKMKG